MRWSESIDMYCERTDPGLWSEPLNAVTNLAFLVAAALLWRRAGRGAGRDMQVLTLLIAAVIASIYSGIATATEAAAIGVVGSLVLSAAQGALTWK